MLVLYLSGPQEFDVVGVVVRMYSKRALSMFWIPGLNGKIEASLRQRIHLLEPFVVTTYLPISIDLHAELPSWAVGSGMEVVVNGPIRNCAAEIDVATIVH